MRTGYMTLRVNMVDVCALPTPSLYSGTGADILCVHLGTDSLKTCLKSGTGNSCSILDRKSHTRDWRAESKLWLKTS